MQHSKEESQALINASKLKANEIADKAERWSNDMRRNAIEHAKRVYDMSNQNMSVFTKQVQEAL